MEKRRVVAVLVGAITLCMAATLCTVFAAGTQTIPKDAKYIGSQKCRSCHTKQYKTWRKTKHYKTFKQLKGDETKDPKCLKCHTTGYGSPSGFVSIEETPELAGTGCESCHGPGSMHAEAAKEAPEEGKWEDPNYPMVIKTSCVTCHNPHIPDKAKPPKADPAE